MAMFHKYPSHDVQASSVTYSADVKPFVRHATGQKRAGGRTLADIGERQRILFSLHLGRDICRCCVSSYPKCKTND